jgi:hypothetical protein
MASELIDVAEQDLGPPCDGVTNSLVEVKDSGVGVGSARGKFRLDEPGIFIKFVASVTEKELGGPGSSIPGDRPVSVRLYLPCWLSVPETDLFIADSPLVLFDGYHLVKGAENDIEVDRLAPEEVFPLGGWESTWC